MKYCLAQLGNKYQGKNKRKIHFTEDGKTAFCNQELKVGHIYPDDDDNDRSEDSDFCKNCLSL